MITGERNAPYYVKYVCLVILTLHSAVLGLSVRHVRSKPGVMFTASTAVVMTEIVKLAACLLMVYIERGRNVQRFLSVIQTQIIRRRKDTIKICLPSFLYILQNNLLYISASNMDAASYQITYQLKILATGLFSVILLKKQLNPKQWYALLLLTIGVVLVNLTETSSVINDHENRVVGCVAALTASVLSAFAGVFFEKMLKGSEISVWVRNIQLSFISLPLGLFTAFFNDYQTITDKGFFFGYDGFVIFVIILQALGGLIVAIVVKHTNSIIKCFGTAIGIILICIGSNYLFYFPLTFQFLIGVIFVIFSIYLYSLN